MMFFCDMRPLRTEDPANPGDLPKLLAVFSGDTSPYASKNKFVTGEAAGFWCFGENGIVPWVFEGTFFGFKGEGEYPGEYSTPLPTSSPRFLAAGRLGDGSGGGLIVKNRSRSAAFF